MRCAADSRDRHSRNVTEFGATSAAGSGAASAKIDRALAFGRSGVGGALARAGRYATARTRRAGRPASSVAQPNIRPPCGADQTSVFTRPCASGLDCQQPTMKPRRPSSAGSGPEAQAASVAAATGNGGSGRSERCVMAFPTSVADGQRPSARRGRGTRRGRRGLRPYGLSVTRVFKSGLRLGDACARIGRCCRGRRDRRERLRRGFSATSWRPAASAARRASIRSRSALKASSCVAFQLASRRQFQPHRVDRLAR